MIDYSFEAYLSESTAADEAKKQGLTAAGYGLWRDKQGKIVAKTVDGVLQPVKGSRANINNYHSDVPKGKEVDHDAIDSVHDVMDKYLTPGTQVDTDITKYGTHKVAAVHPEKAKHLHDDLISAGFKYEKDEDFGSHVYRKGRTTVSVSGKPEIGHKGGAKRDHHSLVISIDHTKPPKKR